MKKIIVILTVGTATLFAALPPQVQNMKDLDQMVDYVKTHPKVAATLHRIDIQKKVVYFGAGCKVIFERQSSSRPAGMVGPAEPLKVSRSTCLEDE